MTTFSHILTVLVCSVLLEVEICSAVEFTNICNNNNDCSPVQIDLFDGTNLEVNSHGIFYKSTRKPNAGNGEFKGNLASNIELKSVRYCRGDDNDVQNAVCLELDNGFQIHVSQSLDEKRNSRAATDLQCNTIYWQPPDGSSVQETPEVCYDMTASQWFGGFESAEQVWPMNSYQKQYTAYVTSDSFQGDTLGSVVEGVFLTSTGNGIIVDETTPLYVSVNQNGSDLFCMKGKVGENTPYFNVSQPFLKYDVCQSNNIQTLWKGVSQKYFPKPTSAPAHDLFRFPIWCTWAIYKQFINQSTVIEFANIIRANNFSVSQLEIDDSWTPHYGDFNFTSDRFPDAVGLINNFTKMDIPATIWMHPFINSDSNAFRELAEKGFLIKSLDSKEPHLVSWWRGTNIAGVLDFTNPEAVKWYLDKLDYLKKTFNVTSFKFDAGELGWISGKYRLHSSLITPNYLTQKYIEMTFQADTDQRRQEVRSGFRSQSSTIMLRMLDRLSDWSHTFGIKTLIPCSLVFGMMGYPYVLPDLIGGNAYGEGTPDPELFIRWLQATVFMPVLQFSIPPWFYNDTVIKISKKYIQLHEQYADKIINLAENAKNTGEPINRPLWWIAPQDEYALQIDSEFLLGDDLLVAPILDKGSTSRDIYLPNGQWRDEQKGQTLQGGVWIKNYSAPLDMLPYFTKLG